MAVAFLVRHLSVHILQRDDAQVDTAPAVGILVDTRSQLLIGLAILCLELHFPFYSGLTLVEVEEHRVLLYDRNCKSLKGPHIHYIQDAQRMLVSAVLEHIPLLSMYMHLAWCPDVQSTLAQLVLGG